MLCNISISKTFSSSPYGIFGYLSTDSSLLGVYFMVFVIVNNDGCSVHIFFLHIYEFLLIIHQHVELLLHMVMPNFQCGCANLYSCLHIIDKRSFAYPSSLTFGIVLMFCRWGKWKCDLVMVLIQVLIYIFLNWLSSYIHSLAIKCCSWSI